MDQGNGAGAQQEPQVEHNKKWMGYLLICGTSLTNFISIGEALDANLSQHYFGRTGVNYMWGVVSFSVALIVLILDLFAFVRNKFDFKSLADGKAEGWFLFLTVLWWLAGLVSITHAGAIGYSALNIYFSAWGSFFSCVYVLNWWGGEHEIMTMKQLTSLSLTLPGWWIVFWASLLMLGSAADSTRLANSQSVKDSCGVAIGLGSNTCLVSMFFVLFHYEFLPCCTRCATWLTYGGWFELVGSVWVNLLLVAALEQLTGAGKIASTITGNGDADSSSQDYVPGSNIYISVWTAFIASVMVTVKWKEARALRVFEELANEDSNTKGEGSAAPTNGATVVETDVDV